MPGPVVGFPAENKKDLKNTSKIIEIRRFLFAGHTGKLRSDSGNELLFTVESEAKIYIEMARCLLCLLYCDISVLQLFCPETFMTYFFIIQLVASSLCLAGGTDQQDWRGRRMKDY